ncbi:unnamed protein product [Adineta steineri]|uniref:TLC domain-containing protein n=1 Tax=Adineta steineri TaxID=433720 RepID=A0A815GVU1_9BILA|nr:unnamed protein product [Adineta steineri]CAF3966275.1 unnamed protein product [Adineta steineri]
MVNIQIEIPLNIPQSNQTLCDNVFRIVLSYFSWLTLSLIARWISKQLIPKVRAMKAKEQMLWQLSITRFIFGLPILWAAYMVYIDGRIALDHVFASTDESWIFTCILTGYFLFEEFALIYFDIKYHGFSKELHIHHFFVLNGCFSVAYYNRGHYYAAKTFLLQISTPFTCICWCLLKLNLEKTKAWKINQWILIYIFHLRSVYEIYCWYGIYQDWNYIKQNLPWIYTINMIVGLAIITIWLTPYWTYRKTVQYFSPNYWYRENEEKKDEINKTS